MKRQKRFLACLLCVLLAGACRPIVASTVDQPTFQLVSHVGGPALSIAVQGDYAFVGFSTELMVLDVADRTQPQWVTALPLPTNDLVIDGQRAALVGVGGFTLLDLATPRAPIVLGRIALDLTPSGVAMTGASAYVIGKDRLFILDLTDARNPSVISQLSLPERLEGVTVQNGVAYLTGNRGLYLVDVSDPYRPAQLSLLAGAPADGAPVLSGDRLYFGSNGQVQLVDVSDPTAPLVLAQADAPTWVSELAVVGEALYVANGNQGLRIFATHNLDPIVAQAQYRARGLVVDVAVQDGYLYLIDADEGLRILSAAPSALREIGAFTPLGVTLRIACTPTDVYVMAGWNRNLHRLDCVDPAAVQQVTAHIGANVVYDFALADHYLYVMATDGLSIIDTAARVQPVLVGRYPGVNPGRVAVTGHTIYHSDNGGTIQVVDVTNPAHPLVVDHYPALGYVSGMTVVDGRAYLPVSQGGMAILAVADDGKLTPSGHYPLDQPVASIAVQPPYAYLAVGKAGIQIVDVTVPSAPRLVSVYDTPGSASDISLVGRNALVADGPGGLLLLDLRNPQAPVEVATYPMPGYAYQVVSAQGLIYVADGLGGLYLLSLTP